MNALFYNIKSGEVEDKLDGRALNDFAKKQLCFVKQSSLTDDPVRLIRLLILSARYEFKIGHEERAWLEMGGVDQILQKDFKINRNRVSSEFSKIFLLYPLQMQTCLQLMKYYGVWEALMSK